MPVVEMLVSQAAGRDEQQLNGTWGNLPCRIAGTESMPLISNTIISNIPPLTGRLQLAVAEINAKLFLLPHHE